jgi:hypothetical protein
MGLPPREVGWVPKSSGETSLTAIVLEMTALVPPYHFLPSLSLRASAYHPVVLAVNGTPL